MKSKKTITKAILYLVLSLGAVIMMFPFFWMILTALKTYPETTAIPLQFWPRQPNLDSFRRAFDYLPWKSLYLNTALTVFFRVLISGITSIMAGYAFGRLRFPFQKFFFLLILAMLMVPSQVFLIPQYLQVAKLKQLNTVFALVYPGLVSAYGVFLMKQAFASLPRELEEVALLDGCSHWRICWQIMVPLLKAPIVAMCIITALWAFKEMAWPLVVNLSQDKMTLAAAMSKVMSEGSSRSDYPLLMASSTIASLPMIVVYMIFQKQFVKGIANTGIK